MKLSKKIVIITALIVVVMGILTVLSIQVVLAGALKMQLEDKGLSLSQVMANDLANPLLDGDLLVVERILKAVQEDGHSVEYAWVVTPGANKVIHTFGSGFPEALLTANPVPSDRIYSIQLLSTEKGPIRDIGMRILDGLDAELHVGFSEKGILSSLQRVTWIVIALTLVGIAIGSLAAWFLGRYVTGPLERLTGLSKHIGEGNFDERIAIDSDDEVGDLARSFNQMAQNLRETIGRLRDSEESYRQQNRGLLAINTVSRVTSLNADLSGVLDQVLSKLVEVMGLSDVQIVISSEALAVADDPRQHDEHLKSLGSAEPKEISRIPLVAKSRVVGSLIVGASASLSDADRGILHAVGRQLGVVIENVELWNRLKRREEMVSQLLQKIITAQEEERKRIARELHDETNQSLAALAVGLKTASALVTRDAEKAESMMEALKESTVAIMRELHNIIYDLRPTLLDDLGLIPAIRWCAENRLATQGVEVAVSATGSPARFPAEIETALFRIAQEAISNAAKYSGASCVQLSLEIKAGAVRLRVEDDGRGFDRDQVLNDKSGKGSLGLLGMIERATLLGGRADVASAPGRGTVIFVEIPIAREGGESNEEDSGSVG